MLLEKLALYYKHFKDLEMQLADTELMKNIKKYSEVAREHRNLQSIMKMYKELKRLNKELEGVKEILEVSEEDEMIELAKMEKEELESKLETLDKDLQLALLPKDPLDKKNIIMEIRAGTGGDEAALFVADLFKMYSRYSESKKWKIDIMNSNPTGIGGFKEIIFMIEGNEVYSNLKYEAGTHRVQRVPATETNGRIHTSAVTVAVLPEAEDVEIEIRNEDIRIDVFRASGPGGQSVNTTDSAIRVTHIPTGLVVSCQDEKSQHKNKAKALKVLRARLYELELAKQEEKLTRSRRAQVGTGDRSGRIRTYNFPQSRVTDHRINLTLYKLDAILGGDIEEVINALQEANQIERIEALNEGIS